jgi:hypothetical protein
MNACTCGSSGTWDGGHVYSHSAAAPCKPAHAAVPSAGTDLTRQDNATYGNKHATTTTKCVTMQCHHAGSCTAQDGVHDAQTEPPAPTPGSPCQLQVISVPEPHTGVTILPAVSPQLCHAAPPLRVRVTGNTTLPSLADTAAAAAAQQVRGALTSCNLGHTSEGTNPQVHLLHAVWASWYLKLQTSLI